MSAKDPALEIDVAIHVPGGSEGSHVRARFSLQEGILVIFGPSGTGKTLTVRAVAGLVHTVTGKIRVCGETLFDSESRRDVKPEHRRVGYVPQNASLFPHLTVRDNVAFGLKARGNGRASTVAEQWLERLGVLRLAERMPRGLSGGETERVALARALAVGPRIVLLDEPFASLDLTTRREMRRLVREVQKESGIPMVFVTHSPREAIEMGDHLVRYGEKGSEKEGRPGDLIQFEED